MNKIYNFLYKDENCLCIERKHSHFTECLSVIKEAHEAQKTYVKKEQEPRITTEEFIEKARIIHGDKYDYIKTKFKNNNTKVCIICPIHGEFWATPSNHLQNRGCRKCGLENEVLKEERKIKTIKK